MLLIGDVDDSCGSRMLPCACSGHCKQLMLLTLLWARLPKFAVHTEMKLWVFRLCNHREKVWECWNVVSQENIISAETVTEETAFQLKTTALSGQGGHTGQGGVAGECLQFHTHSRAIYTCTAAKRNGFPPPHHFPNFGTIRKHAAEQIEELLQAEIYWRKGIFNLEQLPNAIHDAATQNTAASSRERKTPRLDGQVYAR